MSSMTFRRELPSNFDYLSDGGTSWVAIECRAGGYLNADLQRLRDQIELKRQIKAMEVSEFAKDRGKYAALINSMSIEIGRMRFEAIYDACVVSWSTNIQDDGLPMVCDKDHFMELVGVKIEEMATIFLDFAVYIDQVAHFILKADEATIKN